MNENIEKFYKDLGFDKKTMYNYLYKHVKYIDSKKDKAFIGCYPVIKDGILTKIELILSNGNTIEDTIMNVHEVAHFIDIYPYLKKEYVIDNGCEIFPIAMERLFIEKTGDLKLMEWFNKYQIGLMSEADKSEDITGFLNHFDYIDIYKKSGSIPQLLSFKVRENIDLKKELNDKIKELKKEL